MKLKNFFIGILASLVIMLSVIGAVPVHATATKPNSTTGASNLIIHLDSNAENEISYSTQTYTFDPNTEKTTVGPIEYYYKIISFTHGYYLDYTEREREPITETDEDGRVFMTYTTHYYYVIY